MMIPDGLVPTITKLTSQQGEQVTCLECCKYYIAPETAACGHTLCHACWTGRRSCPVCSATLNRRALRLNTPLQVLTGHVHTLTDAFEKLFNTKLDDLLFDIPVALENDPTKHVTEWLASSQNQFSAPVLDSQSSTHAVELTPSKIQIHSHKKKTESTTIVVHAPLPQDDWDKIEVLPDTEEIIKNKENIVGPMDIEPFYIDDNEYSNEHPRRSSRKRELKTDMNTVTRDVSIDKHSSKNSSNETDKRSAKTKQNWSNVKKMRKEFSKLNKKNKSKLNVSIEMCKKAQSTAKPVLVNPVISQTDYVIEDNTPDVVPTRHGDIANKSPDVIVQVSPDQSINKNENSELDKVENSISKSHNEYKENNTDKQPDIVNKENADTIKSIEINLPTNNNENVIQKMDQTNILPLNKKDTFNHESTDNNVRITQNQINSDVITNSTDDIEISIKIGNTITNIFIKKKNDVQLKINTDREIQTSLGPYGLQNMNDASCSPFKGLTVPNIQVNIGDGNKVIPANTTTSTIKKNTDSADTATVNFEITASEEKELSKVMECLETDLVTNKDADKPPSTTETSKFEKPSEVKQVITTEKSHEVPENVDYLNDVDIFGSGSIKEANVQLLKNSKPAPSKILMPTIKSKMSQRLSDKRDRDINNDHDMPRKKKQKVDTDTPSKENVIIPIDESTQEYPKDNGNDSELMNYDNVMGQVFANIDADIKSQNTIKSRINSINNSANHGNQSQHSQIIHRTQFVSTRKHTMPAESSQSYLKECVNEKYSENVFSIIDKESEGLDASGRHNQPPEPCTTQQRVDNLLTPGLCHDLASDRGGNTQTENAEEMMELDLGTPRVDHDDSDKSVVEETPQKNLSFSKLKTKSDIPTKHASETKQPLQKLSESDSQIIKSIINISDTSGESSKLKNTTVLEAIYIGKSKPTLETPLTINKFVNHIKHNSTPVAKKSLNFDTDHVDDADPEQTLCPTTTQEREFLTRAFEQTPKSMVKKPLALKTNHIRESKKFCIAGSCLNVLETSNVKLLCLRRGWTYVDKYTKELTHLVVGVDEENRSQRSVKYMCALAGSKWIVTYKWVEKCLANPKDIVDEEDYEALDAGGDPGPQRSRISTTNLFEGMKFYCMPPFSVLEVGTLKHILEAAGGRVVNEVQEVKVTPDGGNTPALLLAEPENTQEDRFIYLTMELCIVPVNYEWVLNCLGSYTLAPLHDLLLCPPSLLPAATKSWAAALMRCDMSGDIDD